MIANSMRGIAAALLIGTATVAAAGMATVTVAEAAGVRPEVGKPLQAALSLAKQGKGSAAMREVEKAEHVSKLTAEERKVIDQTKQYVMVKTGDFSGGVNNATTAQAKLASDYNNHKWKEVIGQDADYLRKYGALDFKNKLIIAQAYYQSRDYKGAIRYLDGMGDSEQVLTLKMASASKLGDDAAIHDAARTLVMKGQSKYWPYLLRAADHTGGLSDEETLGIYRIRFLTGHMRNADDYSTATQIAIQLGYPQEGLKIEQKGFDDKVLSGTRQQRLLALAQKQAAQQAAKMDAIAKKAQASKNGEDLVSLGEIYWGIGKYQESVDATEAGIKKGVKDKDHAEIVLGMGYTGLKKTSQASKAFGQAKGSAGAKAVADLWTVYARTAK